MGFKTQDGFQFTGSGDGLKYVSGKRISFYISEQGDVGSGDAGSYGGTSGIVSTNIVLDLNTTLTNSYGGSGTTWTDLSGQGNNATLFNSPTYSSDEGGYLDFDGTNDYATFDAGSDTAFGTGNFTVEIWASFVGEGSFYFIDSRNSSQTTNWAFYVNSEEMSIWFTGSGSKFYNDSSVPVWNTGENGWNHIVFSREGTGSNEFKIYINGQHLSSATDTTDYSNSSSEVSIARRYSNSEFLDGKLSQLRIYKGKGLTASEVLQNYLATGSNYFGDIVTTGLVLHLDASNNMSYSGSGTTWTDISGQGNNFTLTNGPTYTSSDGGAIVFDGTNDYAVSATNASFFAFGTSNDYSYGAWVKVDTTAQNESIFSCSTGEGGVTANSFQLDFENATGRIRHVFRHTSGQIISYTSTDVGTGWFYVMVVNDRSEDELKMYFNGSLIDTESNTAFGTDTDVHNFSSSSDSNGVFRIGTNRGEASFIDGSIAQVHIYKGKALTASEVLQNYNATKSNYTLITTNLVLHLDATNSSSYSGSGTTWTDLSGNNYHGTLVNGVSYSSSDGGYLDFDGTNDYVSFSSYTQPAHTSSTSFTWFIWVYPSETNTDNVIMGNRNVSGSNKWTKITPKRFEWVYPDHLDGTGTNVTTNQWQNICITKNGSSFTYYKNGSSIDTVTSSASKDSNPFYLGGDPVYNEHTNCRISIVAVYDAALSASDVLHNYNVTKHHYGL